MINKGNTGSLPNNSKSGTYHVDDIKRQLETNGVISQVCCQLQLTQLTLSVDNKVKGNLYNSVVDQLSVLIMMKIDKKKNLLKESSVINNNLNEHVMTNNQRALTNYYLKTQLIPLLFALEKD
ncbi:hypothetical protein OKN36_14760 [Furfurilactobacillus sp. OKN36]